MAATRAKQGGSRLPALLDAAAVQFAEHGYHGARIRDIAASVAMTPGAIYFHFPSKERLLVAVYENGVRDILERIEAATTGIADPWVRLERAAVSHLQAILEPSAYARVIIRVLPEDVPEAAEELKGLRENYEMPFRRIVSELPLAKEQSAKYFRLFLLGALNWTPVWYHEGEDDVETVVRQFLATIRAWPEGEPG